MPASAHGHQHPQYQHHLPHPHAAAGPGSFASRLSASNAPAVAPVPAEAPAATATRHRLDALASAAPTAETAMTTAESGAPSGEAVAASQSHSQQKRRREPFRPNMVPIPPDLPLTSKTLSELVGDLSRQTKTLVVRQADGMLQETPVIGLIRELLDLRAGGSAFNQLFYIYCLVLEAPGVLSELDTDTRSRIEEAIDSVIKEKAAKSQAQQQNANLDSSVFLRPLRAILAGKSLPVLDSVVAVQSPPKIWPDFCKTDASQWILPSTEPHLRQRHFASDMVSGYVRNPMRFLEKTLTDPVSIWPSNVPFERVVSAVEDMCTSPLFRLFVGAAASNGMNWVPVARIVDGMLLCVYFDLTWHERTRSLCAWVFEVHGSILTGCMQFSKKLIQNFITKTYGSLARKTAADAVPGSAASASSTGTSTAEEEREKAGEGPTAVAAVDADALMNFVSAHTILLLVVVAPSKPFQEFSIRPFCVRPSDSLHDVYASLSPDELSVGLPQDVLEVKKMVQLQGESNVDQLLEHREQRYLLIQFVEGSEGVVRICRYQH